MNVVTRAEAKSRGDKYYFTGKECKNGHVSKRSTNNCACYQCQLEGSKEWRSRNRDYHHDYNRKYREENLEYTKRLNDEYYARQQTENREEYLERCSVRSKQYRQRHPRRIYKQWRKYADENPGKVNAQTAKRRAQKIQATVGWANHNAIQLIYIECAERKEPHHVDHIIPLLSDVVCGLHWEGNLRILTKPANLTKGNKLINNEK